jgi:hypothetical protein
VQHGIVTIETAPLSAGERNRIETVVSGLRGVRRTEVVAMAAPLTVEPGIPERDGAEVGDSGVAEAGAVSADGVVLFPREDLFHPLIADPRWPHFGIAYHAYQNDEELGNVGALSFGESIPFVGGTTGAEGNWQLGLHAGVFAIFDLDADSSDLINADYWVGIPTSWRRRDFSALVRLYHQSSHLGDEFLLRDPDGRVNLSYEAIDLKLSYENIGPLRLYGGAGYLLRKEPSDLDPWSLQVGAEVISPYAFFGGAARPLAAVDLQLYEESDWEPQLSVRTGLQFENPEMTTLMLQVLLEYYDGRNPNGQFYDRDIEYIGVGGHVYF